LTSTPEPRRVPALAVKARPHQQILDHGGLPGISSEQAFESAPASPKQRCLDGELPTIPQLAAASAQAMVTAQAFSDGDKWTGFLVAVVFLGLNGFRFEADNAGVVLLIQRLASGPLEWQELQALVVSNSRAKL